MNGKNTYYAYKEDKFEDAVQSLNTQYHGSEKLSLQLLSNLIEYIKRSNGIVCTDITYHREQFKDSIVFISNSELDGFKEGDGDFMDKLTINLNSFGIEAIRIIENMEEVPEDKKDLEKLGWLKALGDSRKKSLNEYQETFKRMLLTDGYKEKNIILYIGSRINIVRDKDYNIRRDDKGDALLHESGSIFSKTFLLLLKQEFNVKIVISCLEFKFLKRSVIELSRVAEMLRQQLFYADSIHFLNEHDESNFKKTINSLLLNLRLYPDKRLKHNSEDLQFCFKKEIEEIGRARIEELKNKARFVSGVYTVTPLSDEYILRKQTTLKRENDDIIVERLSSRPPNILCFGLIRGEKGISEAINLRQYIDQNWKGDSCPKIYIVGKFMGSIQMLQKMFCLIFSVTIGGSCGLRKAFLHASNHKIDLNKNRNLSTLAQNFPGILGSNKELNIFAAKVYNYLEEQYPERVKGIKVHFNIGEDELHRKAMECSYAIKLDNKGMANNASTIVSCLGWYLPTFTASGLVTGNKFRDDKLHRLSSTAVDLWKFNEYKEAVIMPKKGYTIKDGTEVRPTNFEPQSIFQYLVNESADNRKRYKGRLETIREIMHDRVFNSEVIAAQLMRDVFMALTKSPVREIKRGEGAL